MTDEEEHASGDDEGRQEYASPQDVRRHAVELFVARHTLDQLHDSDPARHSVEQLTNCVRHAQATSAVVVRLASQNGGGVHVSVTDDRLGFDPARRAFGLGLQGMEERVKELQGRFSVRRAGDRGTTVSF